MLSVIYKSFKCAVGHLELKMGVHHWYLFAKN